MKPFSEMTDQELNEWIAVKRGWEAILNYTEVYPPFNIWFNKSLCISKSSLPDYVYSWQWAGGLLAEMPGWEYHVYPDYAIMHRMRLVNNEWETTQIIKPGHTRAIAEAWAEMSNND